MHSVSKKTAEPRLQVHFGPTKSLLRTEKTRLVAANVRDSLIFCCVLAVPRNHWIPLAESTGRTPVEKHCTTIHCLSVCVMFFTFL